MDKFISLGLAIIILLEIRQILIDKRTRRIHTKKLNLHKDIILKFNENWGNNFQLWQQQHEINLKLIEKINEIKGEEVRELVEKINEIDPKNVRVDIEEPSSPEK